MKKTYLVKMELLVSMDDELKEYYDENEGELANALIENDNNIITCELSEKAPMTTW